MFDFDDVKRLFKALGEIAGSTIHRSQGLAQTTFRGYLKYLTQKAINPNTSHNNIHYMLQNLKMALDIDGQVIDAICHDLSNDGGKLHAELLQAEVEEGDYVVDCLRTKYDDGFQFSQSSMVNQAPKSLRTANTIMPRTEKVMHLAHLFSDDPLLLKLSLIDMSNSPDLYAGELIYEEALNRINDIIKDATKNIDVRLAAICALRGLGRLSDLLDILNIEYSTIVNEMDILALQCIHRLIIFLSYDLIESNMNESDLMKLVVFLPHATEDTLTALSDIFIKLTQNENFTTMLLQSGSVDRLLSYVQIAIDSNKSSMIVELSFSLLLSASFRHEHLLKRFVTQNIYHQALLFYQNLLSTEFRTFCEPKTIETYTKVLTLCCTNIETILSNVLSWSLNDELPPYIMLKLLEVIEEILELAGPENIRCFIDQLNGYGLVKKAFFSQNLVLKNISMYIIIKIQNESEIIADLLSDEKMMLELRELSQSENPRIKNVAQQLLILLNLKCAQNYMDKGSVEDALRLYQEILKTPYALYKAKCEAKLGCEKINQHEHRKKTTKLIAQINMFRRDAEPNPVIIPRASGNAEYNDPQQFIPPKL